MPSLRFYRALLPISLALAASAHAAPTPQQPTPPAGEEDDAAQQKLTEQYITSAFNNIDTNKDGKIDTAEFHAFMLKYLARQRAVFDRDFAAADTNHDNKLSRAEVRAANAELSAHFNEVDTNHDGFLTKSEIRASIREHQLQVTLEGSSDEPADASSK